VDLVTLPSSLRASKWFWPDIGRVRCIRNRRELSQRRRRLVGRFWGCFLSRLL
jgi:hypothetical protein